jgi:hypothetical protein
VPHQAILAQPDGTRVNDLVVRLVHFKIFLRRTALESLQDRRLFGRRLILRVAWLIFRNPEFVSFFRGNLFDALPRRNHRHGSVQHGIAEIARLLRCFEEGGKILGAILHQIRIRRPDVFGLQQNGLHP